MRRVVQISDIHFGADDPAAVAALRNDLLAEPYDLLIVSGDLTQRARASQFKAAKAFLDSLPGPQLCVPGNHDVPLHDVFRRFFSPLGKYRKFITDDLRPVFRDEQLLVIGLNTARPFTWRWGGFWKDGRISTDQLLDVHMACIETPDELFKILVTHHPFIPPPGQRKHGAVELEVVETDRPSHNEPPDPQVVHGSGRALRTMESVGVELLVAGHLHMNYTGDVRSHHEAVRRSILSVQAGTACSHRRRGEPNAYNRFTVETAHLDGVPFDRLIVQVRTLNNGQFQNGDCRTFENKPGGWVSSPPPLH